MKNIKITEQKTNPKQEKLQSIESMPKEFTEELKAHLPTDSEHQERPTMRVVTAARACYHSRITENFEASVIAEWIMKHCDIVMHNGRKASLAQLTSRITVVCSSDKIRGKKSHFKKEIEIISKLPKLT